MEAKVSINNNIRCFLLLCPNHVGSSVIILCVRLAQRHCGEVGLGRRRSLFMYMAPTPSSCRFFCRNPASLTMLLALPLRHSPFFHHGGLCSHPHLHRSELTEIAG